MGCHPVSVGFLHQLWGLLLALALVSCPVLAASSPIPPEAPLRLAIQSNQSVTESLEHWQPLADYLGAHIGRRVEVHIYPLGELESALSRNQVDLVLSNPSYYITLKQYYNLSSPVATLVNRSDKQDLEAYCGVIMARADNERIKSLSDLGMARIATTSKDSFGGFRTQMSELLDADLPLIKPEQISLSHIKKEDIPDAVLNGQADVGFVRSGVLERLIRTGRLDPTRIKILNRQPLPTFPLACSTRLYPEWPMVVLPQVSDQTAKRIAVALLSLTPDDKATQAAGLAGFTIPADYDGVEQVMRRLKLPPFTAPAEVRLEDVWRQYRPWILTLGALMLLLAATGIALFHLVKQARQARQRFATLFEFSPEPMWTLENGRFTDCNSAALRMLGYADKGQVVGLTPPQLSPLMQPDGLSSQAKAEMLLDIVGQGQPMRFEWVHVKADGSEFTADVSLSPTHLNGRPIVLCSWYDISDRKHVENELLDIQHQLQGTLSALPDLLFEVDLEGRYFSYRTPNTDLLAAPPSNLVGHTVAEVLPPDAAQICLQALQEANAKGHSFGRQILLPLSMGERWFELSVAKKDGHYVGLPRFVVVSRDITERKQAEAEVRRNQETLHHLANQVPGGLYQYQLFPDGHLIFPYASEGFFELYELTPEALAADPFATRSRWHPEDVQGMLDSIADSARSLTPWKHEYRLQLPIKGLRWMLASARPEAQTDGSILWHGAITDITETKRITEELEHHRHNLETMLAERTRDLVAARDAAESASRAKSTFLANMSHELRTPMNAIIGMSDLALRRARDTQQINYLNKVRRASHHLLSLINDILDLSKIEADRLVLEHIAFDPAAIFDNLTSMLGDRAREKNLEIQLELPQELRQRVFLGDPLRLSQILLNLCGNAIKFTDQGHVGIKAELVSEQADGATLKFSVSDTGPGIRDEDRIRLFHAFEQADSSTTRRFGGTGLGLAISRRLVEAMGGTIGVNSTVGVGSCFWFTLRVGQSHEAPAPKPANLHGSMASLKEKAAGRRILLVEDEPINQEISREILEELGFSVDVANDGLEAVALAKDHDHDLILMDMQMPRMNGLDATVAIHALPGHESCPVIAMTANAFNEDRARCLAAGMVDHVAKPVNPDTLFATLLRWLPE